MADESPTPGTTPVTDHRPVPRGVLPPGVQTWLMAGLAVGIVLIILVAGRPKPAAPHRPIASTSAAQNTDAVRAYQDRLRALEAQAAQEVQAAEATPATSPSGATGSGVPVAQDPTAAERKKRAYESLFASNVVLSHRPAAERPERAETPSVLDHAGASTVAAPATGSSLDALADAVVRATAQARADGAGSALTSVTRAAPGGEGQPALSRASAEPSGRPAYTPPISAAGPLHRILEGTVIDTVLTNRLDGSLASPVNCLVTNPVYSYSGQQVVIPAGSRLLGETKPVQAFGDTRLAVAFHRLILPDGSTESLDQLPGLNQIGDAGLHDQVNQHYWSMFGAAAAVGLISGLAQSVGTSGLDGGTDRTVVIAGGTADATSQASAQVMSRFLNRLPTITIREGHRVKVYLTGDLELPAYTPPAIAPLNGGRP